MTCDRCRQALRFQEWVKEWCPKKKTIDFKHYRIRHTVTEFGGMLGERKLREAYNEMAEAMHKDRSMARNLP